MSIVALGTVIGTQVPSPRRKFSCWPAAGARTRPPDPPVEEVAPVKPPVVEKLTAPAVVAIIASLNVPPSGDVAIVKLPLPNSPICARVELLSADWRAAVSEVEHFEISTDMSPQFESRLV